MGPAIACSSEACSSKKKVKNAGRKVKHGGTATSSKRVESNMKKCKPRSNEDVNTSSNISKSTYTITSLVKSATTALKDTTIVYSGEQQIALTKLNELLASPVVEAPLKRSKNSSIPESSIAYPVTKKARKATEPVESHNEDDEEAGDPSLLENSIFVGNLPLRKIKLKEILELFELSKSDVEAVRFRSIPIHPKFQNNRRAGVFKMEYAGTKNTQNAYIKLKDISKIRQMLKKNGTIFHGLTLRVDTAARGGNFSVFDRKRSVFLGNLPMDAHEEDIRALASTIASVDAVRIIRDKSTSISKGFGFVLFKERKSVPEALKALQAADLKGRKIRVMRVMDEDAAKEQKLTARVSKLKKLSLKSGTKKRSPHPKKLSSLPKKRSPLPKKSYYMKSAGGV